MQMTSLSANALVARVLARHAAERVGEIIERAESLATGAWMRVGNATVPAVYVKISDCHVEVTMEWPDVQVTTEGARIIVAVNTTTIPVTVAVAAKDRRFATLAEIDRLREFDDQRIDEVIVGEVTTIVISDRSLIGLTAI